jgi:ribosome recycling factor
MNTSQLNEVRIKMQSSLDFIQQELNSIRTGRATSSLVENVMVNAYEGAQKLRIREMGNIAISDARTIAIEPWDASVVNDIVKAISDNLNLSASVNENIIRVILPPLTEERRKEFTKLLKQKIEMGKIAIRQIRGDMMHSLKRAGDAKDISEDERTQGEKEMQKLTDEYIEKIEAMEKRKEEEIMTV